MKKISFAALIGASILLSAYTIKTTVNWKTTDSYTVKFTSPKFEGVFKGLKSDIQFDETNLTASSITATIDATTVNTGNGMRNKHAQQGLEASKYPTVKFVSSAITKTSGGYEASGKLTIRDVTKDIKLPFTFTKNATGGVFAGKFSVVPAEYNVKKSGTPDLLEIELNVPVTK